MLVCAGSENVWVCDMVVRTDMDQVDIIHSTCANLKGSVVRNDWGIKKICGEQEDDAKM